MTPVTLFVVIVASTSALAACVLAWFDGAYYGARDAGKGGYESDYHIGIGRLGYRFARTVLPERKARRQARRALRAARRHGGATDDARDVR